MTVYQVTNPGGVRYLANGQRWRKGERFNENQIPPNMLQSLLDEGLVEPVDPQAKPPIAHALMVVPGMSERVAFGLQQIGITTPEELAHAAPVALVGVRGVGDKMASRLIEAAKRMVGADE